MYIAYNILLHTYTYHPLKIDLFCSGVFANRYKTYRTIGVTSGGSMGGLATWRSPLPWAYFFFIKKSELKGR